MTRGEYLEQVIESYLASPDTPSRAGRRDWAIAGSFYQRGIALETIRHAVSLATLRRHRRAPSDRPLEPVVSLAYFRPLVNHLHEVPLEPDYVAYVLWSCEKHLDWSFGEKQNGG